MRREELRDAVKHHLRLAVLRRDGDADPHPLAFADAAEDVGKAREMVGTDELGRDARDEVEEAFGLARLPRGELFEGGGELFEISPRRGL